MTRIVVTGMGILSPFGVGASTLWEGLQSGVSALTPLTSFDTSHVQCRTGGQLLDFTPQKYLNSRMIRKIDRFSVFGLIASQLALQDAGLLMDNTKPVWSSSDEAAARVGLTVGNNLGGWVFAEQELRHLWQEGPHAVSPYMATAWFPAAVQGNVSIQFGIKGVGRTFLSDRASSALALFHAVDCLRRGKVDIMLAGGCEAPFSPYAALCYESSGLMSRQASTGTDDVYRPFDKDHDGLVAGEGAAFFVLEREEDARRRGAHIVAELAGQGSTHDGYDLVRPQSDGKRFATAISQAMTRAQVDTQDIDCIFAAGSAVPEEDLAEVRAIHHAFGESAQDVPVSVPKSAFGNLFGAAFALDLAIAILAMQNQVIPGSKNFAQAAEECDLDFVSSPRPVDHLQTILLNARGMGGANAALVVKSAIDA